MEQSSLISPAGLLLEHDQVALLSAGQEAGPRSTAPRTSAPAQRSRATARARQPAGPTVSDQQEVLITVLGATSLQLSPLVAWVEASSNSTPPLRITESMVAVEQLSNILPRQYSVLYYLHRRGVFQDDGWSQLVQAHIALAESPGVSAV